MDINNIAIVRTTNILPNNGIVKTVSESPYLMKSFGGEFAKQMEQLLIQEGILEPFDFSKFTDEYVDERNKYTNVKLYGLHI